MSEPAIVALAVGSITAIVVVVVVSLLVNSPRRQRSGPSGEHPSPAPAGPSGSTTTIEHRVAGADESAWSSMEAPRPLSRFDPRRSTLRFDDVAGLDQAIEELREVADQLSDPKRFDAVGAECPRGVLLHGPPGCGKTLLARALAGETGVPFYSVSAASFNEQYVGVGAGRVRELFAAAKGHAPCIVFLDELDAMGRSRSDSSGGSAEFDHTLNQLLVELDGFDGASGVLILGATNRLELLDAALLRPGRFDRQIGVERPDRKGREEILALHAARRPFSPRVDWNLVAAHTTGLAPSELANIVNESALLAARRHRSMIAPEDVEEACTRQVSGALRSPLIDDDARWLLAVHEAGHALLSQLLRGVHPPPWVSIVHRGGSLERSAWSASESGEVLTKRELIARLMLLLGGRAAELSVLGEPSTEAEDDVAHAAGLARKMVERWAMTGRFELAAGSRTPMPFVEGSAGGNEVRRLVAGAETAAATILSDNRTTLLRLARVLVERETLPDHEVAQLCGQALGPRHLEPVRSPPAIPQRTQPHPTSERVTVDYEG